MAAQSGNAEELWPLTAWHGDAVLEPAMWPEITEEICAAVAAQDATLLQDYVRAPVGRIAVSGMTCAFDLIRQPAIALDHLGFVLDTNDAAQALFSEDVRIAQRRLILRNPKARSDLDGFLDRMRIAEERLALPADPIIVQRNEKPPILIRILPVDGAACVPLPGARALLILTDLSIRTSPRSGDIARIFGLSAAEARLAAKIATGASLDAAAEETGISRETARNQLKAVFAKTATHRQSELVALLARI